MLVRLRGTATKIDGWDYQLNFDLPTIYFDNINYNISLRNIFIHCNFADGMPVPQYWSLKTFMVDLCEVNPRQEIASFVSNYNPESNYSFVYFEPNIKQEYKIQLTSLHGSEFVLSTLRKDLNLEIEFVEILLEFSRYARI